MFKRQLFSMTLLILLLMSSLVFGYREKGYQYLAPRPEARHVSRYSTLIVRFNSLAPAQLTNLEALFEVRGEISGVHSGKTKIATDQKTIIFTPESAFAAGENVTVKVAPRFRTATPPPVEPLQFQFAISQNEITPDFEALNKTVETSQNFIYKSNEAVPKVGTAMVMSNGVSIPGDFPFVKITINDNPAPGFIFLNNWGGQPYNMILDNTGAPIWYWRTPDRRRDFKVQKNGILTMLVRQGYPFGQGFIGLDQTYTVIDSFHAVDGYWTDEHELQVLENGNYLLIGIRDEKVDMSQYVENGRKNATVSESIIQEFTPNHEKIFEWRAWDNFDIRDTFVPFENELTSNSIRFPHMNAIDIDEDGHILLSSRHLSEVTKINRQTGEIIWRLSGPKNQFTFINDPLNGFENQHDVRYLGNGHYSVFDNGNEHTPPVSRGVEYLLDTENMTATLVWEFRDTPDKYAHFMGNMQRLPNGNTLINWAEDYYPKVTEVRPDGQKAFEMDFILPAYCYRAFRFPWQGQAKIPYLVVEPHREEITLLFNKFGDPNVDYYRIYAGMTPRPKTVIDTSKTTLKRINNLINERDYFFRVTAVAQNGQESDFSNEEQVFVNFIEPGQNMLLNGDFARNKQYWYFGAYDPAQATWRVNDGECHVEIANGGTESWQIQLVQPGIELVQGQEYRFEFDARADANRTIEAIVLRGSEPYTNYGRIGLTAVRNRQQHFSYSFRMLDQSDYNAFVVFFLGKSGANVYLDNISLKKVIDTAIEEESGTVPSHFELHANYPNPFNTRTSISFSVPAESQVQITIYNVLGEVVTELLNKKLPVGRHLIHFEAAGLATGLYFCKLEACSFYDLKSFTAIHKMLLIN